MIEVILARHGQTEFNAREIFRGRADVPLNALGLRQAQLLGEYLAGEKIDVIYSSPLQRAVQTANLVAAHHHLETNIVENLNDIDCGLWQGLPVTDVREKWGELYQDWLDTPEQVKIPGGESLEDVTCRAVPFLWDAVARCGEGKIVVVSHRVVSKVLICALLGLDNSLFWSFRIDTGGISRFEFDGKKAVLTCHNDTSYLKALEGSGLKDF
ncbi:MAG: histidine phosphatase family protein [Dehalococcoidales bacterium]|jgi:broad specificity phosphatase PhoE